VEEAQLLGAPLSSEMSLQQCMKAQTRELALETLGPMIKLVRIFCQS